MAVVKICDVCGKKIPMDCEQTFSGIDSCSDCDITVLQPIANNIYGKTRKEFQNISDEQLALSHYIRTCDWKIPAYKNTFGSYADEFQALKEKLNNLDEKTIIEKAKGETE